MGAITQKIITVTCDHCHEAVTPEHGGGKFLSLGGYGLTFHPGCFTRMSAGELMHHMGEDETILRTIEKGGILKEEGLRLRDPRALRQDGTIDRSRSTETVHWPL